MDRGSKSERVRIVYLNLWDDNPDYPYYFEDENVGADHAMLLIDSQMSQRIQTALCVMQDHDFSAIDFKVEATCKIGDLSTDRKLDFIQHNQETCEGLNFRVRSGKIKIEVNGKYARYSSYVNTIDFLALLESDEEESFDYAAPWVRRTIEKMKETGCYE